ncbi:LRR repeats and ubiquitin-like domain-containing protein At2g30105 [Chenopodium quinoa]|uniref:Ubiquitin-like domain-containing protein n=1 Tax=Chenopodium quinoa TaxID=63459 RepID=A0A803LCV9_CHEQI|nr:LRR repeats and ubiquitin-like domain-containing protein At2g30105 [Chenopodium quinoa]
MSEMVELKIQFGSERFPLSIDINSTVFELKQQLMDSTNVLPKGQQLIHKGAKLVDSKTLRDSGIVNKSKVMLTASGGKFQGGKSPVVPTYQKIMNEDRSLNSAPVKETNILKSSVDRWKMFRVIGLAESNLKAIPDEVWECGSSSGSCPKVLDLSNNYIRDIPSKISCLTSIKKLMLNANDLSDDSISWEDLTQLKYLNYLSLDQNQLTYLPSSLGELTSLEQLHVAGNKLESLPVELGLLTRLEIFKVNNNSLSAVPSHIGDCNALIEVNISFNLLKELPETLGKLQKLQALHLQNNPLKSLPSTLLKNCVKLSTLDVTNTQIAVYELRQIEGWEDFDKRRVLKQNKKLECRTVDSADFDEGADKN